MYKLPKDKDYKSDPFATVYVPNSRDRKSTNNSNRKESQDDFRDLQVRRSQQSPKDYKEDNRAADKSPRHDPFTGYVPTKRERDSINNSNSRFRWSDQRYLEDRRHQWSESKQGDSSYSDRKLYTEDLRDTIAYDQKRKESSHATDRYVDFRDDGHKRKHQEDGEWQNPQKKYKQSDTSSSKPYPSNAPRPDQPLAASQQGSVKKQTLSTDEIITMVIVHLQYNSKRYNGEKLKQLAGASDFLTFCYHFQDLKLGDLNQGGLKNIIRGLSKCHFETFKKLFVELKGQDFLTKELANLYLIFSIRDHEDLAFAENIFTAFPETLLFSTALKNLLNKNKKENIFELAKVIFNRSKGGEIDKFVVFYMLQLCQKYRALAYGQQVFQQALDLVQITPDCLSTFMDFAIAEKKDGFAQEAFESYRKKYPIKENQPLDEFYENMSFVVNNYMRICKKNKEFAKASNIFYEVCNIKIKIETKTKNVVCSNYFLLCIELEKYYELNLGVQHAIEQECVNTINFNIYINGFYQYSPKKLSREVEQLFWQAKKLGIVTAITFGTMIDWVSKADPNKIILFWRAAMEVNIKISRFILEQCITALLKQKTERAFADAKEIFIKTYWDIPDCVNLYYSMMKAAMLKNDLTLAEAIFSQVKKYQHFPEKKRFENCLHNMFFATVINAKFAGKNEKSKSSSENDVEAIYKSIEIKNALGYASFMLFLLRQQRYQEIPDVFNAAKNFLSATIYTFYLLYLFTQHDKKNIIGIFNEVKTETHLSVDLVGIFILSLSTEENILYLKELLTVAEQQKILSSKHIDLVSEFCKLHPQIQIEQWAKDLNANHKLPPSLMLNFPSYPLTQEKFTRLIKKLSPFCEADVDSDIEKNNVRRQSNKLKASNSPTLSVAPKQIESQSSDGLEHDIAQDLCNSSSSNKNSDFFPDYEYHQTPGKSIVDNLQSPTTTASLNSVSQDELQKSPISSILGSSSSPLFFPAAADDRKPIPLPTTTAVSSTSTGIAKPKVMLKLRVRPQANTSIINSDISTTSTSTAQNTSSKNHSTINAVTTEQNQSQQRPSIGNKAPRSLSMLFSQTETATTKKPCSNTKVQTSSSSITNKSIIQPFNGAMKTPRPECLIMPTNQNEIVYSSLAELHKFIKDNNGLKNDELALKFYESKGFEIYDLKSAAHFFNNHFLVALEGEVSEKISIAKLKKKSIEDAIDDYGEHDYKAPVELAVPVDEDDYLEDLQDEYEEEANKDYHFPNTSNREQQSGSKNDEEADGEFYQNFTT